MWSKSWRTNGRRPWAGHNHRFDDGYYGDNDDDDGDDGGDDGDDGGDDGDDDGGVDGDDGDDGDDYWSCLFDVDVTMLSKISTV